MGHHPILPHRARVDLEPTTMKRYSAFPKAPAFLEPYHQIVKCHISTFIREGGSYSSEKMLYSTVPADWVIEDKNAYVI